MNVHYNFINTTVDIHMDEADETYSGVDSIFFPGDGSAHIFSGEIIEVLRFSGLIIEPTTGHVIKHEGTRYWEVPCNEHSTTT